MGLTRREVKPEIVFHTWDDVMTFGQFKDMTVREVAEENPQYLLWAQDNVEWFDLEVDVYDELVDMLWPPPEYY